MESVLTADYVAVRTVARAVKQYLSNQIRTATRERCRQTTHTTDLKRKYRFEFSILHSGSNLKIWFSDTRWILSRTARYFRHHHHHSFSVGQYVLLWDYRVISQDGLFWKCTASARCTLAQLGISDYPLHLIHYSACFIQCSALKKILAFCSP